MANYRPVYVTEIADTLHLYAQDVETGMCTLTLECTNDKLNFHLNIATAADKNTVLYVFVRKIQNLMQNTLVDEIQIHKVDNTV